MYNPDAVGTWLYDKYPNLFQSTLKNTSLTVVTHSVMPSVTPVNFATMYTGLMPTGHGIQTYVRPVLTVETIFDTFLKAGKRVAIVSAMNCTFANIFNERQMDYYKCETIEKLHATVADLIREDKHDLIAIHAWNYDSVMHKFGPESPEALAELKANTEAFCEFDNLIRKYWKGHNTLVAFAMDHGCHEIDGGCGSHGLDMDEDLNIDHLYTTHKREEV
jgi:predicted AlkP superfamily pyrophosphatase or phosphodiesterase